MKLNLGSGDKYLEGYTNIDIDPSVKPDILFDIANDGLAFCENNSVDEVRAHDFLEHIPLGKTIFVVDEIWRVLKPGGRFESFTPDAEYGQGAFQDPTHLSFWCENSWLYYSGNGIRKQYGINANFDIEHMERINTDVIHRVFHLLVIARAIKR